MPEIEVMVNGLPGNMGLEIAGACLRQGIAIAPIALTGPGMPANVDVTDMSGGDAVSIKLLNAECDLEKEIAEVKARCKNENKILIAIDFTHPTAVNKNAELYCKCKLPFVMGTTGGDRDLLAKCVKDADLYALIAPNMCKQIVAFQAMMDTMATNYPGAFGTYTLDITESHQNGKADTSGTAKEMVKYLNKMVGTPFSVEDIKKLREPAEQIAFGVPEDALLGHAWHTYTLKSSDGSVMFQFKHNVCGRRTYAEGVADACKYLARKIEGKSEVKQFDMIDVLKAGDMN